MRLPALATITNESAESDSVDLSFSSVSELSLPSLQSAAGGWFLDAPLVTLDLGAVAVLDEVFLAETSLVNVDMFCGVTEVTGSLSLRNNGLLDNLGGFASLTDVGTLDVFQQGSLPGHPLIDFCEVRTVLTQTGALAGTMERAVPAVGCPLPDTCAGE